MTTRPPLWRELATTVEDAISPVLNRRLGPRLPPLRWSARADGSDIVWSGQASSGDYAENEAESAVLEWAVHLRCETRLRHGTVEFSCTTQGEYIVVWGVVDRDLFEKGLPSTKE